MKEYQYRKIDAFTAQNSTGNPAACIYTENIEELSETQMLEIARQHKGFVSEVIYCSPISDSSSSYFLRYYSSECEVDFCGHGTIACIYNLIKETSTLQDQEQILISTGKKGDVTVFNEIKSKDSIYISAPEPCYIGTYIDKDIIARKLQIPLDRISNNYPVDIIDAGLRTLIVPIVSLKDEVNIYPNEQELKAFCSANEIDIVLIYSLEVSDNNNKAHTRVFAPKFGYLEDPATGSGNSAFGYYLLKNKLWDGTDISLEQGGSDRIFNTIKLSFRDNRVLFGGSATTRIKGVFYL